MKKGNERRGLGKGDIDNKYGAAPEGPQGTRPSLHDLYYTEDIDIEEELRLMEADPRLRDVTGDPGTLDKIKAQWAKMQEDVELSEELSDITNVVSPEELAHLSPKAKELIERGIKASEQDAQEDEPKVRLIRKRNKRILLAVAAIMVLSLAASTTGVTSLYKNLQVEEKGVEDQFRVVDSDKDLVMTEVNEMEIYQQVDKFFGVPVVKLYGDLAGVEFKEVLFHEEDNSVDLVYEYDGNRIYYSIQSNYNQLSQMAGVLETLLEEVEWEHKGVLITLEKHTSDLPNNINYITTFTFNNYYYKIQMNQGNEKLIENILNNLHF